MRRVAGGLVVIAPLLASCSSILGIEDRRVSAATDASTNPPPSGTDAGTLDGAPDGARDCALTLPMLTGGDDGWSTVGSTTRENGSLRLTYGESAQSGAAWWRDPARFSRFDASVRVRIDYTKEFPADGFAFAWLRGRATPPAGGTGGTYGLEGLPGYAVVLYLYDNQLPSVPGFAVIDLTKPVENWQWALKKAEIGKPAADGVEHVVRVALEGNLVSAWFDQQKVIDGFALPAYQAFDGRWGISASTGGFAATFRVPNVSFDGVLTGCP